MEHQNHGGVCEAFNNGKQQRRSANYKPNIWKYEFLQSLSSKFDEQEDQYEERIEKLKREARRVLAETKDFLVKLELIDNIEKVGLGNYFEEEIKESLETILVSFQSNFPYVGDLHATALSFRLLRQHSLEVTQDLFSVFLDETGTFKETKCKEVKGVLELFEASHLAFEGEQILVEAKSYAYGVLKSSCPIIEDSNLKNKVVHVLKLPYHWRLQWFDVKWQLNVLENASDVLEPILELAKLNFNVVQATLQKDLREVARWWWNLGLMEKVGFARDRLVESFLCSAGVAFERKYSHLRIWLTKVITMILIIDDAYDVYGSLEEMHCFTNAVNRWDPKEIEGLPECLTTCFEALRSITDEIVHDMQKEKGWGQLEQPQFEKVWAQFCRALFVEAKWYRKGYIPSLEDYLENGWISSSGIVLSTHLLFSITNQKSDFIQQNHNLLHNISLVIRLCNDLGTSQAEQERGDAATSVVCYMEEANVEEEEARKHINGKTDQAWRRINGAVLTQLQSEHGVVDPEVRTLIDMNTNMARVAQNLYQNGRDKFRDQDSDNRRQFLSLLVHPFQPSVIRSVISRRESQSNGSY